MSPPDNDDLQGSLPFILGQMDGKLDLLLQNQLQVKDQLDDHAKRLRKLEGWKAYVVGGAAVITAILYTIIDWFKK